MIENALWMKSQNKTAKRKHTKKKKIPIVRLTILWHFRCCLILIHTGGRGNQNTCIAVKNPFNSLPHNPYFWRLLGSSLLKTLWEKEKRGPWWPWIAHLSHFPHNWILHLCSFGSNLWPSGWGHFWLLRNHMNKIDTGQHRDAKYQIPKL